MAALFTIARKWRQPKFPSTDEWINKIGHFQAMYYYSAIERNDPCYDLNEPCKHYAESSQTRRATFCMNLLPRNEWTGKSLETGSSRAVARGWGRTGGSGEVRAPGYEVSLPSDANVLQLDSGDSCTAFWTCQVCAFKRWILWCVNLILVKTENLFCLPSKCGMEQEELNSAALWARRWTNGGWSHVGQLMEENSRAAGPLEATRSTPHHQESENGGRGQPGLSLWGTDSNLAPSKSKFQVD